MQLRKSVRSLLMNMLPPLNDDGLLEMMKEITREEKIHKMRKSLWRRLVEQLSAQLS